MCGSPVPGASEHAKLNLLGLVIDVEEEGDVRRLKEGNDADGELRVVVKTPRG